ncbi:hypothetical protein [Ewingella americana]|uniref:Uncharacterized protein n=1 Tax=Ewingella americana TaxID=41202 RepID=A0A502GEN5_9GAMM|nr:hypothetical protein [Ewingella americana]TPG60082.1 hypothetical protein EAH77_16065 [Ewingella americana]
MLLGYLKASNTGFKLQSTFDLETSCIDVIIDGCLQGHIRLSEDGAILNSDSVQPAQRLLVLSLAPILRSNASIFNDEDHIFISLINDNLVIWRTKADAQEIRNKTTLNMTSNNIQCDDADEFANLAIMITIS